MSTQITSGNANVMEHFGRKLGFLHTEYSYNHYHTESIDYATIASMCCEVCVHEDLPASHAAIGPSDVSCRW